MTRCHVSGFSALRLARGARAGHRAPSLYTDESVPLPLVEVQHLALTMASGDVRADFLAATLVLT